jgi:hypothetical protein
LQAGCLRRQHEEQAAAKRAAEGRTRVVNVAVSDRPDTATGAMSAALSVKPGECSSGAGRDPT